MNINIRDKNNALYSIDILDIKKLHMHVEDKNGKYIVRINSEYILDEEFTDKDSAEKTIKNLTNVSNELINKSED